MDQEKNPVDLLDEILNRGQEEPRPSSYPPKFDPPLPENEPPPPEQKAPLRERAVPWLCGLLGGAAVTGLLCAVLLTSLNQRLDQLGAAVDEIQAVDELRKENERLRTSIRSLVTTQQDMLSSQREQEQIAQQRQQRYSELLNHTGRQTLLLYLERFCAQGEWLVAACAVENRDYIFAPYVFSFGSTVSLNAMTKRYFQLREDVFEQSKLLALERIDIDEEQYFQQATLTPDTGPYDPKAVEAAMELWPIFCVYGEGRHSNAAQLLAEFCHPEHQYLKELEGGAFQPSTIELFEQVRADLLAQGFLEENPDGTLSAVSRSEEIDPPIIYGTYGD